ncbi:LOW QUALITY PROTEIN: hypothetical protein CVT26_009256 [Gymnopilus dilepis]|uniref:Uncharacterized protein n=1 Tax=Gymnopilus dilepis TaxID=231916 RepID=A0A409YA92_9AGAR|nr:LOW QUALITY PROTEIN: hypothetical protein CVT26_009256 [Gymnopilus dilepis]
MSTRDYTNPVHSLHRGSRVTSSYTLGSALNDTIKFSSDPNSSIPDLFGLLNLTDEQLQAVLPADRKNPLRDYQLPFMIIRFYVLYCDIPLKFDASRYSFSNIKDVKIGYYEITLTKFRNKELKNLQLFELFQAVGVGLLDMSNAQKKGIEEKLILYSIEQQNGPVWDANFKLFPKHDN